MSYCAVALRAAASSSWKSIGLAAIAFTCETAALMDVLRSLDVAGGGHIELCVGHLGLLQPVDDVDLLVVSAFPDDYSPTPGSVIGALDKRGVSVSELAADKLVDLRATSSCWLSQPIDAERAGFRQLMCFEPIAGARAAEVVGDVFRALIPFVSATEGLRRVAMPLLATGDMHRSVDEMIPALLEAATRWMKAGLPLQSLRLVLQPESDVETQACALFDGWKDAGVPDPAPPADRPYDIFISYAHSDGSATRQLIFESISALRPQAKIFVDTLDLPTGSAWPSKIFEALNQCRKIVAVLTPEYLVSKPCQTELNVAFTRTFAGDDEVLHPFYAREADLPYHLRALQYVDCLVDDPRKIQAACEALVGHL